ncbi:MAG: GDP-L-fucose synthase family protein [Gemmatimonadota bacterium]
MMPTLRPDDAIYVAGHRGLVGSALVRALRARGFTNLITAGREEVDLTDAAATRAFLLEARPRYALLAAARVGGILANSTYPADFLRDNLAIELNTITALHEAGVEKALFLGSSCIYPREAPQPIPEEALLTGPLEPTNEAYAVAKIAGIKLCQAYRSQYGAHFISAMPTNLYGPGDNFDLETSHVLPALIRRFHEAKVSGAPAVTLWGTGTPRREFLHVDDLAEACIFLLERYDEDAPINVGTGKDLTIAELASLVARVVSYEGEIRYDSSRPDGTPRKLLDVSRIRALGWSPSILLEQGIRDTYAWFREHHSEPRSEELAGA